MKMSKGNYSQLQSSLYKPFFPETWNESNLYSLATWLNGMAFKDFQFTGTGRPIIKIAEIKNGITDQTNFTASDYDRAYYIRQGDMLFAWSGQPDTSIDVYWWRGEEGWLNQHIFKVNPSSECDRTFFYYLLKYLKPNFVAIASNKQTTGLGHVTIRDLSNLLVRIPEKKTQHAIASVLGTLDDKIELNRRMNATLESMARAVFRQWFVENEEVGKWRIGRLGDFIKVNERNITKDYPYNEIEYLDISSVSLGRLDGTTSYTLRESPSRAKRLVQHGDTIWSTVRPNRKSYLFIGNPKESLVVSTGFAVLTPVRIPPSFLYFYVTTEQFVDYLVSNADGSAYPAVSPDRFAYAEFPIPPKDVLDKFENIAGSMLAQIAHSEKESRTLTSLRDTLLPRLMSGEALIKEMEHQYEAS